MIAEVGGSPPLPPPDLVEAPYKLKGCSPGLAYPANLPHIEASAAIPRW